MAKSHGVCHVTLNGYVEKLQKLDERGSKELPRVGYWSSKTIFIPAKQSELVWQKSVCNLLVFQNSIYILNTAAILTTLH